MAEDDLPLGSELLTLVAVMDRLRSPGGCPWDAEQTHETLVEYLIEETFETVEAIETGSRDELIEELGDLLLQVAFHSRIGQESQDPWDIDDVARGITTKLIERHPHVFADATVTDSQDSERQWQLQKNAQKGRTSATDGIPQALPSLVLAAKLHRRARHAGVEIVAEEAVAAQANSLLDSVNSDPAALGGLLVELVRQAAARGIDVDAAVRQGNRALTTKIRATETPAS